MKKRKINKKLRIASICSLLIIASILSFLLYQELKYPAFQEEKVALYNYTTMTDVNYNVLLKPNIIYENESLDEEVIYISPYVDIIQASFNYMFEGDNNVDIMGDYEFIALLEGFTTQVDKETKIIWQRKYIIEPRTSFETRDNKIAILKDIPIKFDQYNDYAKQVIEDTKVQSPVNLSVVMNINMQANTDNGIVKEKISPSLVIPLNTNYFEITKNVPEEKNGAIEETQKVQLPVNNNKVIIYSSIIGLMLITLIFLIFFTYGYVKDEFSKQLDKIFKKHGSRLVALNGNISTSSITLTVKTIDDLVRIADEIDKPIMYKYSANPQEISQFYVSDENTLYLFNLKKAVEALEADKPPKKDKKNNKHEKVIEKGKENNIPS